MVLLPVINILLVELGDKCLPIKQKSEKQQKLITQNCQICLAAIQWLSTATKHINVHPTEVIYI